MALKKDPNRSCGDCSECCTVTHVYSDNVFNPEKPGVPIWHKPERRPCKFLNKSGSGCSIFKTSCPKSCREYICEWLRGQPVRKPIDSGVIFFASNTKYGNPTIMVGSKTDEAYGHEETKNEIQRYRDLGYPVLLMHDDGKRTLIE